MKARRINLGQPIGHPAVIVNRRAGFSLIELLVVIGVILILVGIATVGISSIVASAHQRQTRTMLEAAAALVNEYNVELGTVKAQESIQEWKWTWTPGATPIDVDLTLSNFSGKGLNFFTVPYRGTGNPPALTDSPSPMPVPGPGDDWQKTNTAILMRTLDRLPAIHKTLSQLPKDSTTGLSGPGVKSTGLRDAWGNPLLFVPATGLGLPTSVSGNAGHVLANVNKHGSTDVADWDATILDTIKSPDGKAFWASAGPDGDFRTGDDNLYSFGEQ